MPRIEYSVSPPGTRLSNGDTVPAEMASLSISAGPTICLVDTPTNLIGILETLTEDLRRIHRHIQA